LPRGRLAALAACRLLLGSRAALRRAAAGTAAARPGLLAAAGRRARGVRDLRRALLRHALLLQLLVLLLVLDVRLLARHWSPPLLGSSHRCPPRDVRNGLSHRTDRRGQVW